MYLSPARYRRNIGFTKNNYRVNAKPVRTLGTPSLEKGARALSALGPAKLIAVIVPSNEPTGNDCKELVAVVTTRQTLPGFASSLN
jgi:hypothetical protein